MAITAVLAAELLTVYCPGCIEPISNPDNGADGWKPEEIRQAAQEKWTLICGGCGATIRVPCPKKVSLPQ
jgi:hypothetical protein